MRDYHWMSYRGDEILRVVGVSIKNVSRDESDKNIENVKLSIGIAQTGPD
ncbi:hypothetical protein KKG72_08170 [bacterium]|nr:hypothetical protein [bacterium]